MTRPIALTMGDPAGIGPEITVKAWKALRRTQPFVLIGSAAAIAQHAQDIPLWKISDVAEASGVFTDALPILDIALEEGPVPGIPHAGNAAAVITAIEVAVELAGTGHCSALVTNPISKQVLMDGAGFAFPGHTEFLAHLGGCSDVVMLLAAPDLRVVPVTIHIPLAQVADFLTPTLLATAIRITARAMATDFGVANARIAVAGLNPHAGEGGKMGREELDMISPTLDNLRREGLDITGPLSADTMFHPAARESYDVAVCMYHDQALIPIKTLDFAGGVNCTLGLPFVRTSPDHGTAFDIAGQGIADESSLVAAIRLASDMAARRAGSA